jgi:uroporphyrinogen decarboxylase
MTETPSQHPTTPPLQHSRFLSACRREATDTTPIWLMRQAGRYMPEYRAVKARFASMLEMVKDSAVAAEITMQPVRAFDIDAAIIFADILTVLDAMGLPLEFVKGEGPVFRRTIGSAADVDALAPIEPRSSLAYTLEAIRLVKRELGGRIPLIGFSGAPFTLACYAIEGQSSREFVKAKSFMYREPAAWARLMEKLADAIGDYLAAQAEAGADVLQLFDSWVGALSPADYREYVLPYSRRAIERALAPRRVPLIHFGTGTAGILHLIREAGGDVIGVDWRTDLASAWNGLGPDVAVQGNLDPAVLFSSPEIIRKQAARILDSVRGRRGHIFNLGHGIMEHTPVEHVKLLVDFVHEHAAKGNGGEQHGRATQR